MHDESAAHAPRCDIVQHGKISQDTGLLRRPSSRLTSRICKHAFTDYCPDRFLWATRFLFLFFLIFSFLCRSLVSFWAHVNMPYRIASITRISARRQPDMQFHSLHVVEILTLTFLTITATVKLKKKLAVIRLISAEHLHNDAVIWHITSMAAPSRRRHCQST